MIKMAELIKKQGDIIRRQTGMKLTEVKRIKYKERDWKKYEKLVKKGKNVAVQTAFGDEFTWDTADRDGVWGLDQDGKEFELTHDDIDLVIIY